MAATGIASVLLGFAAYAATDPGSAKLPKSAANHTQFKLLPEEFN
jgi:hypothetical protein